MRAAGRSTIFWKTHGWDDRRWIFSRITGIDAVMAGSGTDGNLSLWEGIHGGRGRDSRANLLEFYAVSDILKVGSVAPVWTRDISLGRVSFWSRSWAPLPGAAPSR